jgi:hypothetical protein
MDALQLDYYTSPNVWRNRLPDYQAHAYERYQQGWYEDEKRSYIERFLIDILFKNVMSSFCTFFHLTNICLKERTLHASTFHRFFIARLYFADGLRSLFLVISARLSCPLLFSQNRW